MGNDASRVTVASGVNSWRVSPDGARWYWLSGSARPTGAGALQSAPFRRAPARSRSRPASCQYEFPSPSRCWSSTDSAKKLLRSPIRPAPHHQPVARHRRDRVRGLQRQGHVAYVKTISTLGAVGTSFTDLFVKKTDGTGACAVTSATDALPVRVRSSRPARAALAWTQRAHHVGPGPVHALVRLHAMKVGANVVVCAEPIGDRAILFHGRVRTASPGRRRRSSGASPPGRSPPIRPPWSAARSALHGPVRGRRRHARLHGQRRRRTTTASTSRPSVPSPSARVAYGAGNRRPAFRLTPSAVFRRLPAV